MVRPRCGDFLYSSLELDVMIEDIRSFRQLGVFGVVFGILTCGGRIDIARTKQFVTTCIIFYCELADAVCRLVEEALPMQGVYLYFLLCVPANPVTSMFS